MRKTTAKLISVTLMMVLSLCLMTVSSYAYLVLSHNPAVSGIAVSVSGGDTIKMAANIQAVGENGEIINYPGFFSGSLEMSADGYKALRPVSTTDGINWYFPKEIEKKAYTYTPGVAEREEKSLRDEGEFVHDALLEYANIPQDSARQSKGSYIYYDFWVVSPARDCVLRVSTGDDEGSYVLNMPSVKKSEKNGQTVYSIDTSEKGASAYTRVGFLVNEDVQTDGSMNRYVEQPQYNSAYNKLKGSYGQKNQDGNMAGKTTFTIYEPNCNSHPVLTGAGVYTNVGVQAGAVSHGDYVITSPLSRIGNIHILGDVAKQVTAQKETVWNSEKLKGRFETFLEFSKEKIEGMDEKQLSAAFYTGWLKSNCDDYITIGKFISSTTSLYAKASGDMGLKQTVEENVLNTLETSGATNDVDIVYLERNVPQRIRMFVYLEGQDVDCVSSSEISNLIVHMELAGSNKI